jgi:acyl-CoA synthetase (AMP-forming)/AMP-acid ligase II
VRLIFNGAEPICADLCRRFTHTMAAHGLRPNSLFPVYGLAEATLAVSFPQRQTAVETVCLDRTSLSLGQPVRGAEPHSPGHCEFVKVGQPLSGIDVRIADAGGTELGAGVLGHVLMRGDNVSAGYYRQPEKTAASQHGDGWVDTGDLGLFADGQLVITGRAKDLVIVNGQNYHPHDLERVAEQVIGIDANRVAAAGVRAAGGDTEALALFVLHRGEIGDFVPKVLELRRAMLAHTGLDAAHIVPVKHIPKTTSGKLQRYALVEAFERGEFDDVTAEVGALLAAIGAPHADEIVASPTVRRLQEICAGFVAGRTLSAHTSLLEIDLSSLSLARIHEAIDRDYPDRIEITDLIDNPRLEQLAALLDTADC